jgi:broad specificity phosphatase PhoE
VIPTRLILIRHAEVEEKYFNTFGGRIDMDLSPQGNQQASALAGYLRGERIDAIYASPMKRVQQTLAPLLQNGAPRPIILPGLREMDFGDWTGMRWSEIVNRHKVSTSQWLQLLASGAVEGAEDETVLRARVAPCLQQIIAEQPARTSLIACHGGIVRVILAVALDLPLTEFGSFDVEYASVTVLEVRHGRTYLKLLNFTPWRNGR